ncbi:riboflavin synthase alpha chain [Uncinocarpus reesii 1704]|uniref:Riboflavin synthase alpha chain n=1 Tax=Uncinocarpus reesii (strain UAMH 1704) TaxID=336963 RepID=C4JYS1_UNCRE|nr:riboflavin synthase alpha chain [Uncinocarpus reesii 1704]EEP82457.1 riboflavin synthase alpha chain [Uncinocarpus reesii 1704]
MFTGLVETIGVVTALEPQDDTSSGGGGTSLTISDCEEILTDAQLGDSICVNGEEFASIPLLSPYSATAPLTIMETHRSMSYYHDFRQIFLQSWRGTGNSSSHEFGLPRIRV